MAKDLMRKALIECEKYEVQRSYRAKQPKEYDFKARQEAFYVELLCRMYDLLRGRGEDVEHRRSYERILLKIAKGLLVFSDPSTEEGFSHINKHNNTLFVATIYYICGYEAIASLLLRRSNPIFLETSAAQQLYSLVRGAEYPDSEEKWGYWARFIWLQRYKEGSKPLYRRLFNLIKDKNYFIITTNVDHQFQLSGFDKSRLFYTQGDYGLFQCSKPCHTKTYDNEKAVREMIENLQDVHIKTGLIPKCPICGREMSTNLRSDDRFVEDAGWHKAAERYTRFLEKNKNKSVLFLELGVGWNTPSIIKYPFINMTYQYPNAYYVCINKGENYIPKEIAQKSMVMDDDIARVLAALEK